MNKDKMPHADHPKQKPATREEVASQLANPDGKIVAKHWFNTNKNVYNFENSLMELLYQSKLMHNNKGIGSVDKEDLTLINSQFTNDLYVEKPLIINLSN